MPMKTKSHYHIEVKWPPLSTYWVEIGLFTVPTEAEARFDVYCRDNPQNKYRIIETTETVIKEWK